MTSRADTHDLDKLRRWQKDLEDTPPGAPGVFAIFLVSGEDQAAHDVFRAFRASFEDRGLGFSHLVIFGQHGVSATARRLKDAFGLAEDSGPWLVVYPGQGTRTEVIALSGGAAEGPGPTVEPGQAGIGWRTGLQRLEAIIDGGEQCGPEPVESVKRLCAEVIELEQP